VRDLTWTGTGDRILLWVSATSASFTPESLKGWNRVELVGLSEVIPGRIAPADTYTVIFESTCNSVLNYDPVILARTIWSHFNRAPDALVAPSLEVPVATQQAIACEVGQTLGGARVDVVTIAERSSPQSVKKLGKDPADEGQETATALDEALEIAAGKKRGKPVDEEAAAFVYAYTSAVRRRTPFRCTPLQRRILQAVAYGIRPTTPEIARAVFAAENKVNDGIADLVDALVPRAAGERERRDSHGRLYWLVHRYGVWIRLVDRRP
jgi:hypothetical protein